MPPLRTVSRDTPKGKHFTKKQPLKGAVFCFQRRRAESRFPAAVQSAAAVQSCHSRSVPQQPFSPAAVVQSAATGVQSAATVVQFCRSRSILPQSFNPPQPFNPAVTVQSRNSRSVRHSRSVPQQHFESSGVSPRICNRHKRIPPVPIAYLHPDAVSIGIKAPFGIFPHIQELCLALMVNAEIRKSLVLQKEGPDHHLNRMVDAPPQKTVILSDVVLVFSVRAD